MMTVPSKNCHIGRILGLGGSILAQHSLMAASLYGTVPERLWIARFWPL